MKGLEFPIIGTKVSGLTKKFDIESPAGRKKYFDAKVGSEIKAIKKFLADSTFIAYFLGKKSSGKGTYSKLIAEALGEDKIAHVSVGDLVRETDVRKRLVKTQRVKKLKRDYSAHVSLL